jgi:hypothetical protein
MDLTQGAFRDGEGVIPDKPSGKNVYWLTVWLYPEEAGLTNVALIHLISHRIHNRQTTINMEPKHQRYSHCISLRIEAHTWDEDMIYQIAEGLMEWYLQEISTQRLFFNRSFIFRKRSIG